MREQLSLPFERPGGAATGGAPSVDDARRSIDALVSQALTYRSSRSYSELLMFVARFRAYSPFNALLIHLQMAGAQFIAPAHRWLSDYGRRVKPGQRPLVILQPFGPVMFVYDLSQTEPVDLTQALPPRVEQPFAMPPLRGVETALNWTVENVKADGVRVTFVAAGTGSAGSLRAVRSGLTQDVVVKRQPPQHRWVPVRYETEVNCELSATERYATVSHELGHLYCGHVGTTNPAWWPERSRVSQAVAEFEAESVAYLACQRIDPRAQLPPHVAQFVHDGQDVPDISLSRVMTAAGRVIEVAGRWVKPRDRATGPTDRRQD